MNRPSDVRIDGQQVFGQVAAVHLGHDHIGHEQIDAAGVFLGQADGLARGSGCQHGVPQPFEHFRGHFQDRRFVFHQQDSLVASLAWFIRFLFRQRDRFGQVARQVDLEGRSLARLAVDIDETVVLLDHAVDRGQAQSGAFAHFLGGEERFEEMSLGLLVHAAAVIAHGQQDIFAGDKTRVIGAVCLVEGGYCRSRW